MSFGNGTVRNVIIFDFDNSLSSHCDNCKNNFLVLGESPTLELMENLDHQRKKLVSILLKWIQNFLEFTL